MGYVMKFGDVPIAESVGAILAHKLYDSAGKLVFNKGHILQSDDVDVLRQHGLQSVIVTQLSASDLHEDDAAERIGRAVAGENVVMRAPGVGRANLTAGQRGILHVNVPALALVNNIYDGITIATLREYTLVDEREMVALVKIVPFGVPEARVVDIEQVARATSSILRVEPLQEKQVALIISGTDATREQLMTRFSDAVRDRVVGWGSQLHEPQFVHHAVDDIAVAIQGQSNTDMVIIASMSAIIDRDDVVPSALVQAGGSITLHGVPVDPGTLLMMGYLGDVPVIGAPGCITSPKTNVIDWILPRLLTGERITRANLVSMGHGGLLKDIADRPMPRSATDNV